MNTKHVQTAIVALMNKQKIFHSEADFQFSLAWELQRILPAAKIRLEYCPPFATEMHIDIYVIDEEGTYPIELKYKSRTIETIVDNEYFKLKEHGAQDSGRYDYLYDISRIEKVCQLDSQFQAGYAIMLSNDSAYWKSPSPRKTVDAAFRIHEGRSIGGICAWDENVSAGTIKSREMPIVLDGTYSIHWDFYSEIENANNGQFKLCLIEIKKRF